MQELVGRFVRGARSPPLADARAGSMQSLDVAVIRLPPLARVDGALPSAHPHHMADASSPAAPPPVRTFGRVRGRPLRAGRAALVDAALPGLALDLAAGPVDAAALMPQTRAVWLELGFGGGEHLAAQAAAHPGVLLLGAEPFLNGVASTVRHLQAAGAGNVRLHAGDGRDLIAALPDASVGRVFILFPDPWPKARHHKRRLITDDSLAALARIVVPGGRLRFATDWADYADWTLERGLRAPDWAWTAARADDWRRPPADHVTTRYEQKGLGNCAPIFLEFERR